MYFHNIDANKTVKFMISICQTNFDHKIILKGTCYARRKGIVDFVLQITTSYKWVPGFFPGVKPAGEWC